MTHGRARSIAIALGLSLLLHLAALGLLRASAIARPLDPPAPRTPDILRIYRRPTPPPTPPPKPPEPRRATVPATHLHANPPAVRIVAPNSHAIHAGAATEPHAVAAATGGSGGGQPPAGPSNDAAQSGLPAPVAAPTPSDSPLPAATASACPRPPYDASVTEVVTPDRPEIAAQAGAFGHVDVRVDLDATGAVQRASIHTSSGNAALDQAALGAAEHARYAPASDGCAAIGGSYLYRVDFSE